MTDIVERIDANKRNSTELEDEAAEVIVVLRQRVAELEAELKKWHAFGSAISAASSNFTVQVPEKRND